MAYLSISHWGLFPVDVEAEAKIWLNEQLELTLAHVQNRIAQLRQSRSI